MVFDFLKILLDFLNKNSGTLLVIFSGLVAFSTFVYALLTWRLVSETRRMREFQTEPKISVTFQPREEWINFIDLVIQNTGLGPAYNIKFEIDNDFEYKEGKSLSELNLIKKGLKYLAPNQKFQFFLTSLVENFEKKVRTPFEIKVNYRNNLGKTYEDSYVIDFSELIGLIQLGSPPLHKIAKNLEKIQKDIEATKNLLEEYKRNKVLEEYKQNKEDKR